MKATLYSAQFIKNYQLLYKKWSDIISPEFIFDEEGLKSIYNEINANNSNVEMSTFLAFLAIYEVECSKKRKNFSKTEWDDFFSIFPRISSFQITEFKEHVFKKNLKNYAWTLAEDEFLKEIINKLVIQTSSRHIPWKAVAQQLNLSGIVSQIRAPGKCEERWKNVLKLKHKKGNWTSEEDITILKFMKDRGSKWSKIALILTNRTEHSIKNRFFGILSKFIDMPQKKMKTELNYLSQNFLNSIISKYMTSIIKKEDYIDYFPIQNSNSEQKTIKENYSYLPHPEEQQSILSENKEEKTVISENLDIFKYINFERGNTKIFY